MCDSGNEHEEVQRHESGRWKKGTVSPNPAGRPVKVDSLTGLLREFALVKGVDGRSYRERVVKQLWLEAAAGSAWAVKLVFDRCDGLLTQTIEQLSKVEVTYEDWDTEPDELANTSAVPTGEEEPRENAV